MDANALQKMASLYLLEQWMGLTSAFLMAPGAKDSWSENG
jgi:hypothetical protein